jgi:CRP/FNR family cyclic AMP-dependent transcriptional regulator
VETAQVIALLKRTPLFAGLDEDILEQLAKQARMRRLPKNQTVVVEGEPGDSMGVVYEGWLRVMVRSPQGDEAELDRIGPAADFGLVAMLDGGPRTASIETVEPSTLLVFRRDDIYPLFQSEPRLLEAVFRSLCRLIRRADDAVADQLFLTLKARVAKALIELNGDAPAQRFTQADLANRVGATRQSVNQVLRDFERRRFIEHAGRAIVILRMDDLRRLASG